ncbi:MAG: DUF2437 domain-containing protein [Pirellulaceae bacterium]
MQYCRFQSADAIELGLFQDDRIIPLRSIDPQLPSTMQELMQVENLKSKLAGAAKAESIEASSVRLLAPITQPEKVICIGLNYRDHAIETNSPIPEQPVVFSKFPSTVIGPAIPSFCHRSAIASIMKPNWSS